MTNEDFKDDKRLKSIRIDSDISKISDKQYVDMFCLKHNKKFTIRLKNLKHQKTIGCDECMNRTFDKEKFGIIHHGKYDYSKVLYTNKDTPVEIICPVHGSFMQTPSTHSHSGCPKCGELEKSKKLSVFMKERYTKKSVSPSYEEALHARFASLYGENYVLKSIKDGVLEVYCKKHDCTNFGLKYNILSKGRCCCHLCYRETEIEKTIAELKIKFIEKHKNKYDYNWGSYKSTREGMQIFCKQHNEWFTQTPRNHLLGHGCPRCGHTLSKAEDEIYEFVLSVYDKEVIRHSRLVIKPQEVDIYIPERKVAFEYNGIYWHSEQFAGKLYHYEKAKACFDKGINLVHIYEDDWRDKKEIIKRKIVSLLGLNSKLQARKGTVRRISNTKEVRDFLNDNHIQGYIPASVTLGLFFEGKIEALMSFSKSRYTDKADYELVRYCSTANVIGGASKLFKHFERTFGPCSVVSYANFDFSNGCLYEKLGFKLLGFSKPSYSYVDYGNRRALRENREKYQKHKLNATLENFDQNLSEYENMKNNNYYRIYNSGNMVFFKQCSS
jgi:hypothetical protein